MEPIHVDLPSTNGEEYYVGAAIMVQFSTGRALPISIPVTGRVGRFIGWCENRVTGDGINRVTCRIDGGIYSTFMVKGARIYANGHPRIGDLVYKRDEDTTLTIKPPTNGATPCGIIVQKHEYTYDVLMFEGENNRDMTATAITAAIFTDNATLRAQRDALLAALPRVMDVARQVHNARPMTDEELAAMGAAEAAIAKCREKGVSAKAAWASAAERIRKAEEVKP